METTPSATIISFVDTKLIDESVLTDPFRDELLQAARDADPPNMIVNLDGVEFFGSSFIELLFRAWNRLQGGNDRRLILSGLSSYCREILDIARLDQLWEFSEDLDSAVAAVA